MEKTKYRYKCMICGTEVVSADDVLSCNACGSDELAKFELAPVIDIAKKAPSKKPARRRKIPSDFMFDSDLKPSIDAIFRDLDPPPPRPSRIPPIHISSPPPPPPPTKWERISRCLPWKILFRIFAPLAIGGTIYGIVRLFL